MNFKIPLFVFVYCVFVACKRDSLQINVSHIDAEISIERFDIDFFSLANFSTKNNSPSKLAEKYNPFFDNYTQYVIQIGKREELDFQKELSDFFNDSIISKLYDTCQHIFSDIKSIEKEISQGFKYYKYYFPEKNLPRILTHISGFNESIILDKGIISIGIDKYLGSNHTFYKRLGIHKYLRKKMKPKQIPTDVFLAIGKTEIPQGKLNTLLDYMVYYGKVYYFLKAMFPKKNEYELFNFDENQELWCKVNEADMWRFLASKNHLFSSDKKIINRYIQDAPFTKGFPEGSPDKTGIWIGLQIIKSYMKNSKITLIEMLYQVDYELILRKSGYRPS